MANPNDLSRLSNSALEAEINRLRSAPPAAHMRVELEGWLALLVAEQKRRAADMLEGARHAVAKWMCRG